MTVISTKQGERLREAFAMHLEQLGNENNGLASIVRQLPDATLEDVLNESRNPSVLEEEAWWKANSVPEAVAHKIAHLIETYLNGPELSRLRTMTKGVFSGPETAFLWSNILHMARASKDDDGEKITSAEYRKQLADDIIYNPYLFVQGYGDGIGLPKAMQGQAFFSRLDRLAKKSKMPEPVREGMRQLSATVLATLIRTTEDNKVMHLVNIAGEPSGRLISTVRKILGQKKLSGHVILDVMKELASENFDLKEEYGTEFNIDFTLTETTSKSNKYRRFAIRGLYFREKRATARLLDRLAKPPRPLPEGWGEAVASLRENGRPLGEDQIKALETMWRLSFSVVTGQPGTGKTSLLPHFYKLLRHFSPESDAMFLAPTGTGARRIEAMMRQNGINKSASTIHAGLNLGGIFADSRGKFPYGETVWEKVHDDGYLIVDEASMLDIRLLYAVLRAGSSYNKEFKKFVPTTVRIVLFGDFNQLPPVYAGDPSALEHVFSNFVPPQGYMNPLARLTTLRRGRGEITTVIQGVFPLTGDKIPEWWKSLSGKDEEGRVHKVVSTTWEETMNRLFEITERLGGEQVAMANTWRVVTPTKALRDAINNAFRAKFHDGDISPTKYVVGDPVMYTRNNYDPDVNLRNGSFGHVTKVTETSENTMLTVYFDELDGEVQIPVGDTIDHAWCSTIHKAQGSEWDAVILVAPPKEILPEELLKVDMLDDDYNFVTAAKTKPINEVSEKEKWPYPGVAASWKKIAYTALSRARTDAFLLVGPNPDDFLERIDGLGIKPVESDLRNIMPLKLLNERGWSKKPEPQAKPKFGTDDLRAKMLGETAATSEDSVEDADTENAGKEKGTEDGEEV